MRYIDELLMRRQNSNFSNDSPNITYDDTWYHCTDAQFSTVAVLDDTAEVIERVYYDAYGQARVCPREDVDGDGDVDQDDEDIVDKNPESQPGPGDVDRDGDVDATDTASVSNAIGKDWALGRLSGPAGAGGTDNIIGWDGYVFNEELDGAGMYTVRFRHYRPGLGRWLERDIAEYADSMNMYEVVRSSPVRYSDPSGLWVGLISYLRAKAVEQGWESPTIPRCQFKGQKLELVFDGSNFRFGKCACDAVSGKRTGSVDAPGFSGGIFEYTKARQRKRDEGPIPEGEYWISTCEGRDADSTPSVHGYWRGFWERFAWGDFSWPIHIMPGTDTMDDDPLNPRARGLLGERFYIHGGANWGSAGCIDLKNHDGTFRSFMDEVSKANFSSCCYIPLTVTYDVDEVLKDDKEWKCPCAK